MRNWLNVRQHTVRSCACTCSSPRRSLVPRRNQHRGPRLHLEVRLWVPEKAHEGESGFRKLFFFFFLRECLWEGTIFQNYAFAPWPLQAPKPTGETEHALRLPARWRCAFRIWSIVIILKENNLTLRFLPNFRAIILTACISTFKKSFNLCFLDSKHSLSSLFCFIISLSV